MRRRWRATTFRDWNAIVLKKGMTYAIIPDPPFHSRVRWFFWQAQFDLRLWAAKKLCHEAIHEKYL